MRELQKKIVKLNYSYLVLVKEMAQRTGLAPGFFGLPEQVVKEIRETEYDALMRIAEIGMPIFRLQADQIRAALAARDTGAKARLIIQALEGAGND